MEKEVHVVLVDLTSGNEGIILPAGIFDKKEDADALVSRLNETVKKMHDSAPIWWLGGPSMKCEIHSIESNKVPENLEHWINKTMPVQYRLSNGKDL